MKNSRFNANYIDIIPRIVSVLIILIGSFVMAGWVFNIPELKSILPNWSSMKISTAIEFILCGTTLLLVNSQSIKQWLVTILSLIIISLSLTTVANYAINTGFDLEYLFNSADSKSMPLITAVNFVLVGFLFLITKSKKYTLLFNILIFIVGFNSLLSLLAYLYWYALPIYPEMALHSALAFILLIVGLICSNPQLMIINYLKSHKFSEDNFKKILEATPDAIVMINQMGKIIFVNQQTEKLFGYANSELLNQFVEVLIPEPYRSRHPEHRQHFFKEPKPRPMGIGMELFGLRKNQEIFPIEISLSPFDTNDGIVGLAAIRDITDRKHFELTLKEKNLELENAILAKDRFLASMSHELRTPLNAIIGFTGTLLMKLPGPLNAEQEKQLNTVKRSAKHLLSLINELLDLAKINSGKIELNFETTNCQNIISEVYSTLLPLATSKELELNVDLPTEEINIQTDKRSLTQIIINLVNNAIKFTEKGGVTIKLMKQKKDGKSIVVIKIIDTGLGIKLEDQEKLFQAFQQISIADKNLEGTGLGLHLSQKLAHLLNGEIRMESQVDKGSIFSLELPIEG